MVLDNLKKMVRLKKEKTVVAETKEVVVDATKVSVINRTGQFVREFSLEVHGENFQKLAKEFCETNGAGTFKIV